MPAPDLTDEESAAVAAAPGKLIAKGTGLNFRSGWIPAFAGTRVDGDVAPIPAVCLTVWRWQWSTGATASPHPLKPAGRQTLVGPIAPYDGGASVQADANH